MKEISENDLPPSKFLMQFQESVDYRNVSRGKA